MEAKAYLDQYLGLKRDIECMEAENEQWLYIAGGLAPPSLGDKVQTSGNQQKNEDAILRYMKKVKENEAKIERLKEKMAEILSTIAKVENTTLRRILLLHYTEKKKLGTIAAEICYSYQHTKELHGIALEKVQRIIGKE